MSPDESLQVACRIRDIRMRRYDEDPAYRAIVDKQIMAKLAELGEVTIPEGTCERIWRERIVPEIEKSAVAQ